MGNSALPEAPLLLSALLVASRLLHDHLHSIEVISLHFEIRYPAIPLGRFYIAVSKKILDGAKISVRIEELRGHLVPEMMAGNMELCFAGILFHTLLNAADRD